MRVVSEKECEPQEVDGVLVQVRRLVWSDGGLSFEVHRVSDGADLTEMECFDSYPTDEQIRALLT